jgi:hypothetical protein
VHGIVSGSFSVFFLQGIPGEGRFKSPDNQVNRALPEAFCRGIENSPFLKHAATFIIPCSSSDFMQDIVSTRKMENGIVVFYDEKDEKKYESFNYEELIDMKINALDLLDRPKSYKLDKAAHKLVARR